MTSEQRVFEERQRSDERNTADEARNHRRTTEPTSNILSADNEAAMTETRQSTPEQVPQTPQHDENEQRHGDRSHAEHNRNESPLHAARRASLKKEICAGWRRALGH